MLGNKLSVEFDERKIDAICSAIDQCHLPGAAVGIAIDGKPVYRKGFGLANMELPVVITPTMRLRIGSTSKHFTALAYLLLCEQGKAGIDDPIGRYLPELHPVSRGVTPRQLMGNTGGLRDAFDISWQFSGTGQAVSSADLLSLYRDIDDVNAEPGTAWIYNNGGYLMLSTAIERITSRSLEDVLSESIFRPTGMYDSMLRRFDGDFVPNSATLHMTTRSGGFEKSYLGTALTGEGGIVSTVDDMLLWLAHMDEPVVGKAPTWDLMKAPQVLANGTSTGYGLGLRKDHYRGVDTLCHGGAVMGGNSQMLKVPQAGLDVVIMVNRRDVIGATLVNRILDACLPGLEPVKEGVQPVTAGIFRSLASGRVIELLAKEGRQLASIDGMDMPVEHEDGTLWLTGNRRAPRQSIVLRGDPTKPDSLLFNDYGNIEEFARADPPGIPDGEPITGDYRCKAIRSGAMICQSGDNIWLKTTGAFGSAEFALERLTTGVWRARSTEVMPWGGTLSFDGDGKAFRFYSPRNRRLVFRRARA